MLSDRKQWLGQSKFLLEELDVLSGDTQLLFLDQGLLQTLAHELYPILFCIGVLFAIIVLKPGGLYDVHS